MRFCVNTSFSLIAKALEWLTWTLPEAASMRGLDLSSFCDFGQVQKAVLLLSSYCSRILLHVHVLQFFYGKRNLTTTGCRIVGLYKPRECRFRGFGTVSSWPRNWCILSQVTAKRVNCHKKECILMQSHFLFGESSHLVGSFAQSIQGTHALLWRSWITSTHRKFGSACLARACQGVSFIPFILYGVCTFFLVSVQPMFAHGPDSDLHNFCSGGNSNSNLTWHKELMLLSWCCLGAYKCSFLDWFFACLYMLLRRGPNLGSSEVLHTVGRGCALRLNLRRKGIWNSSPNIARPCLVSLLMYVVLPFPYSCLLFPRYCYVGAILVAIGTVLLHCSVVPSRFWTTVANKFCCGRCTMCFLMLFCAPCAWLVSLLRYWSLAKICAIHFFQANLEYF